jgi:tetratricopeptide (TPR) repeat protein
MVGNFSGAREDVITARDVAEEFGLKEWAASMSMRLGDIELLAGNPSAAEKTLRPGCEALEKIGDLAHLSSATARLARALYELGRYEEAFQMSRKSENVAACDDLDPQTLCRMTQAKVLAQWGQFEHAERLAREAVRISEPTDLLNLRADALGDLAEVLHLAGRRQEAITTHQEAIDLYERKGNVVSMEKARTRFDELGATNTPVS